MGFWDDLTGKSASKAANAAAADTYAKQQAAGQQYADATRSIADQYYSPYVQTGQQTNSLLANFLGVNGRDQQQLAYDNYLESPDQAYRVGKGIDAINASAATPGRSLNSGRLLKELTRYGQGEASQDFGNYMARLMGYNQQGLGAASGAAGLTGQGAAGQFNANYGGAGTIGQGMVAGANAESSALGNLLNVGAGLAGSALGSPWLGSLMNTGRSSSYSPSTVYGSAGNYGVPTFGR